MKKRLLACMLSLSLTFNLTVPALASGMSDDGIYYVEDSDLYPPPVDYLAAVPDDIIVNPEDYVINSGVSGSSLGLTLSMGQIAALIAGGVGTVYLASNWDSLGSHLQTALNEAAELNGGAAALTYWLENARQGVIALTSAPVWITQTILNTCYNIHQGLSYPTSSPFGSYDIPVSGSIMQSGVTYPIGLTANFNTGEVSSYSEISATQPCYVFRTYETSYSSDGKTFNLISTYWLFSVTNSQPYIYYKARGASSGSSRLLANQYVGSDGLVYRYGSYSGKAMSATVSNEIQMQVAQHFLDKYYKPGAIESSSFDAVAMCGSLYGSVPYSPTFNEVPVGDSVCPDALVGGISQAWTNDTLGADVIDLPDILIDGSGVITGTDTATLDASISTTLDKVATGELAWDDYWIDISNSVPVAKVEDATSGEVVQRPIAPDGTLQDPVVVPDWSTDPGDYTMDLTRFFPFCIPFDLYDFFSCLAADPETPKFSFVLPFLDGEEFSIEIDLSPYDEVAQIVRNLELFMFVIMLATVTRDKMIKG